VPDTATPVEAPTLSHREVLVVLGGAMLGLFLAALDQTIVATALPTMAAELRGGAHIAWVVSAYLLTATASTPIYGKMSDLYGRRAMFTVGIAVFVTASMLCGFAQTMGQLIAARALQGLGGGGLIALAQATVGDVVAPRERGRYQAYISGVWAAASVSGPVFGGLFTDYASWRWVFWINLPLGVLALTVLRRTLRRLAPKRVEHSIDWLGAALLVAAVTCLLLMTSWGGVVLPWLSPAIGALLVGGIGLFIVFAAWEWRATEPIVPPRLMRNPVFRMGGAISFVNAMVMVGTTAFLPLFLQFVYGMSASNSGLLVLPMSVGTTIGSLSAGRAMSRTGRYKPWPLAGLVIATLAFLGLALCGPATPDFVVCVLTAFVGIGLGLTFPPLLVSVQNAVARHDLGTATGCVAFFRSMGGSLGVAALGAILIGGISGGGAAASGVLHGGPAAVAQLPEATREAFLGALAGSFHKVFLACAGLTLLSALLVSFLKEIPLRSGAQPPSAR
jgi:EmrB/QacA subfamily drug resistance transporter